jgi:hypothetical protein
MLFIYIINVIKFNIMAIQKSMIKFSGKIGDELVGFKSYKKHGLRKYNGNPRVPNTLPQRQVKSSFAVAVASVKPIVPVVRLGFAHATNGTMSAYNACVKYTVKNAVIGDYPNYEVDYEKVRISVGNLAGGGEAKMTYANATCVFTWDEGSIEGASDMVLLAVVNTTQNEAAIDLTAMREDKTKSISVPSNWKTGDEVVSYIGFASEKECSNSMYLGNATV